jgi:DNA-directed RNA polymerase subunit RPC12/RpoP
MRLVCVSCGRHIYTVSPLESLSGAELACPRCSGVLVVERRGVSISPALSVTQQAERRKAAPR